MSHSSVLRFASRLLPVVVALPAVAQAHPGHDGHELTWDFGHLAAHPIATLGWVALITTSLWCAIQLARSSATPAKIRTERREPRR